MQFKYTIKYIKNLSSFIHISPNKMIMLVNNPVRGLVHHTNVWIDYILRRYLFCNTQQIKRYNGNAYIKKKNQSSNLHYPYRSA